MKYSYMESFFSKKRKGWLPSPNITPLEADTWLDFCQELERFGKFEWPSKQQAPLISPAYYDNIKYRKNINVSGWSFLSLDFDEGATILDTLEYLVSLNYNYILYTTASHTDTKDKFRVFVPYSREVMPDEMDEVWAGGYVLFLNKIDAQCKDKSRGYYVPGQYSAGTAFYTWYADGVNLDPEDLKLLAPPKPKPVEFVPTTVSDPTKGLFNASWTGIIDCPFVVDKWVNEYLSLASGHGRHYSTMYKFMIRVAGRAQYFLYDLQPGQIIALAQELDRMKDSRWSNRAWTKEAMNAIKFVKTGEK